MTFKTQMATDAAGVFLSTSEFAETVTYTPSGGSGRSISAVVDRTQYVSQVGADGATDERHAMLYASTDATSGVGTSPGLDDTITIGSDTWHVVAVVQQDDAMAALDIVRLVPSERSRSDYRRNR